MVLWGNVFYYSSGLMKALWLDWVYRKWKKPVMCVYMSPPPLPALDITWWLSNKRYHSFPIFSRITSGYGEILPCLEIDDVRPQEGQLAIENLSQTLSGVVLAWKSESYNDDNNQSILECLWQSSHSVNHSNQMYTCRYSDLQIKLSPLHYSHSSEVGWKRHNIDSSPIPEHKMRMNQVSQPRF